jgi:hypothetical protein
MDAVAVLRIPIADLRKALGTYADEAQQSADKGFETLRSAAGGPLLVRAVNDATLVFTGSPVRGKDPEELGLLVQRALGDSLDAHDDARGILVFPDVVEPSGTSYSALVDEIGEAGEWVPRVAAADAQVALPDGGDLSAHLGQVMNALGPDLASLSQQLMSGDKQAFADAVSKVQNALASTGADKHLAEALGGAGTDDPFGKLNLDALQGEAQKMLADNPELAADLKKHMGDDSED